MLDICSGLTIDLISNKFTGKTQRKDQSYCHMMEKCEDKESRESGSTEFNINRKIFVGNVSYRVSYLVFQIWAIFIIDYQNQSENLFN